MQEAPNSCGACGEYSQMQGTAVRPASGCCVAVHSSLHREDNQFCSTVYEEKWCMPSPGRKRRDLERPRSVTTKRLGR